MFLTKKDQGEFYNCLPNSFCEAHFDVKVHLENGIFLLKDGDLGVFYKFDGVYDEPLIPDELKDALNPFMKGFRNVIRGIPKHLELKNTVIQIFCSQRLVKTPPILVSYSDSVTGSILKSEEDHLFKNSGMLKRDFYLSIRFTPQVEKVSKFKIFEDFVSSRSKMKQDECKKIIDKISVFESELNLFENQFTSEQNLKRCGPSELVSYTQNILHACKTMPTIVDEGNISSSIYNSEMKVEGPQISIGDKENIKIYYLEQLPSIYKFGMFKHFMDFIPTANWDIVWTLSDGLGKYDTPLIAREGWYGRKTSKKVEFEEFVHFRQNIDNFRPYGLQSLKLICYNTDSNFDSSLESISLDYIGSRILLEKQIPVHMLAISLPLNCNTISNRVKGRHRKIRLENSMAFLPIFSGPKFEKGFRWNSSRNFQPCRFDLFAGEGNRMTTVLGASRAGKSVLVNQLILEFLERYPDGIVRIIDKRTSYLKLCDLLEGKIIHFSEESLRANPYSPFALETWSEDDIENIFLLVMTVIVQKNPGVKTTSIHTEILREAIKLSYNNHAKNLQMVSSDVEPHPTWEDVLSNLPIASANLKTNDEKEIDQAKDDIVLWTIGLTRTGQYGFIFSKHEKSAPTDDLKILVYDLDGNSDPILRQISAMMAFIKISRDLSKIKRSVKKLIIFEELGMLLYGDDQAQKLNEEFIQNVVKTCAKLNAQALALTNNVDDYTKKQAGRTLWENATQKIFLPLGGLYDNAYKAWKDEFNEAEWQILKSLKKEFEHRRSSAFIKSSNDIAPWTGSIFLVLTPPMDALTTSSGSQMELYFNLRQDGLSAQESLAKMWTDYAYGENL